MHKILKLALSLLITAEINCSSWERRERKDYELLLAQRSDLLLALDRNIQDSCQKLDETQNNISNHFEKSIERINNAFDTCGKSLYGRAYDEQVRNKQRNLETSSSSDLPTAPTDDPWTVIMQQRLAALNQSSSSNK